MIIKNNKRYFFSSGHSLPSWAGWRDRSSSRQWYAESTLDHSMQLIVRKISQSFTGLKPS